MYSFRATLLFVVLALFLTACPGGEGVTGSAPQITSFTANPETITAAGQAVALSWTVTNGVTSLELDNGVGEVSGTSEVVYPSATTTYTLSASNSSGTTTQSVEVTVGPGVGPTPGPGAEDGLPPTLNTFGVSLEQSDFQSDQGSNIENASDPRVVRVQPNSTFYAVVSAIDPGGIAGATIFLANSSPTDFKADLVQGQPVNGFTLNGEVSGCVLDGTQTSVTCVYEIAVGNISNITALPGVSGEFAYVFRTRVADASGLESDTPPRGYVIVGEGGGTPNPPPGNPPPSDPPPGNPPPPSDPPPGNPPANRAPTANFTSNQEDGTLKVAFRSTSTDPDDAASTLKYAWTFGDGKTATTRDHSNTYAKAGEFSVSLKVTDPDGASNTETKSVTVKPVGGGGGGGNNAPTVSITGPSDSSITLTLASGTVQQEFTAEGKDADGDPIKYVWSVVPSTGVTISAMNEAKTNVTFTQANTYAVKVTATDSKGASNSDTVSVKVNSPTDAPNEKPVAELKAEPEEVSYSSTARTVVFDASESSDTEDGDGTNLTYEWKLLRDPRGPSSPIKIDIDNDRNDATRQFTVPQDPPGEYEVQVVAVDSKGAKSSPKNATFKALPPTLSIKADGLTNSSIEVEPSSATLFTAEFEGAIVATEEVEWKLVAAEGETGSKTKNSATSNDGNDINYTAPLEENTIKLTAKLTDYPSVVQTVTIEVESGE